MTKLVLVGAGGHARVLIELFSAMGGFELVGVVAHTAPRDPLGLPLLGDESRLKRLRAEGVEAAFIGVGDNATRARLGAWLERLGYELPAAIHPAAFVAPSARISPGAVVMARAVLGTDAALGSLAILNTGAIADHDVVLHEASHAAPGSVLAGHAWLGARALLGAGSAVRQGIGIGEDAVVGVGAAVVTDVAAGTVVGGVPAGLLDRNH